MADWGDKSGAAAVTQAGTGSQQHQQAAEVEEYDVAGTRRLFDEQGNNLVADEYLVKHGDIVLVPQPTESPNDPLNWSRARKVWHSSLVLFVVALTAATSNDAGAGSEAIHEQYQIGYHVFNTGAGLLFIGIGFWCLLSSPAVHLYGRRIQYLISMLLALIGSIWYGRIQDTADTIWSQLFVGASESVAEAAVQLSLLDIWFEHQNGSTLGLYTLAMAVGTYLGPLMASHVGYRLGWRWIGYTGAIFSAATFLLLYFGLEETAFRPEDRSSSHSRRKGYWERIRPITPAPNLRGLGLQQYGSRLWHTLRIFTFPAVWFAGLQWAMQNVVLTVTLTVQEDYWYEAPWYYDDTQVGNMNVPSLIGSIVGCFYGGFCSDSFLIWMTKRNGGVMEAEDRLHLMSLCLILFPIGVCLFGFGSARGWDWPVPYLGLAFIGFGYGCAGDLSITYLADAYPGMVLEGMVGVAVINNSLAMVFSFLTSDWLETGLEACFIELGLLSFLVLALTFPTIFWGKRWRRWTKGRYLAFIDIRDGFSN